MSKPKSMLSEKIELRAQAQQLLGGRAAETGNECAPPAYDVLFRLASSPQTADSALALLHELQVHQVELELQDEELRRSRYELESELAQARRRFDLAPVGLYNLEADTTLVELNLAGAALLGCDRVQVQGRRLADFLSPQGEKDLNALMHRPAAAPMASSGPLRLACLRVRESQVWASAQADTASGRWLVSFSPCPAAGDARAQ